MFRDNTKSTGETTEEAFIKTQQEKEIELATIHATEAKGIKALSPLGKMEQAKLYKMLALFEVIEESEQDREKYVEPIKQLRGVIHMRIKLRRGEEPGSEAYARRVKASLGGILVNDAKEMKDLLGIEVNWKKRARKIVKKMEEDEKFLREQLNLGVNLGPNFTEATLKNLEDLRKTYAAKMRITRNKKSASIDFPPFSEVLISIERVWHQHKHKIIPNMSEEVRDSLDDFFEGLHRELEDKFLQLYGKTEKVEVEDS